MNRPLHTRHRLVSVVGVLIGIIVLQVVLAVVSIDILSSVRAYVAGESLYSKGQKDALLHLNEYAQHHREDDYRLFLASLDVNDGDRIAREALLAAVPDTERARRGFLQGRNHPQDIDGLIRLFLWFHRVPFMADAIAHWTEGDAVIGQVRALVERAHERIAAGDPRADAVREMRDRLPQLNARLTALEQAFSARLGEASRTTRWLLLGLNLGVAAMLVAAGGSFVRRTLRLQTQHESDLRSREEALRLLLDSTAEGIFGVDNAGLCTFINRAALRMLGYEHEFELLGRPIRLLVGVPGGGGEVDTAVDADTAGARRQAVVQTLQRRDGRAFPAECWSHAVAHDGRVHGSVVTFFDISDRLQMQAELEKRELRISDLIGAVTEGVVALDADSRIVLFNLAAERLFGVTQSQALGRPIDGFIPGGFGAASVVPAPRSTAGAGVLHELVGVRANGDKLPLEASVSTIDTEHGVLTTLVLRDMTEVNAARIERQAREALEAASRAKTAFLSRISHELRTPLNAVLGFAQLLRLDSVPSLSAEQLERVHHIERAGAHLLGLVNDVLDLSRMEAGQLPLSLDAVNLRVVMRESLALVSTMAAAAAVVLDAGPVELVDDHGGDQALVQADHLRLRQVMVNLLSNAVKYNRRGGAVTVSWRRHAGCWQVCIADTGAGMTPVQLRQLFQPFNRLGAERTAVEGTGIGLVLSLELIKAMNGTLEVHSEAGEGTVVRVTLPVGQRARDERPVRWAAGPCAAEPKRLRLLYAEDNEVNVELVRQVVALRPGIALRVATDGRQALRLAREEPPDLMLLDIHLGDMDGIELARKFRRDKRTAGIPLIALSADALDEQIEAALAAGFDRYLTKPIDFGCLLEVLDEDPSVHRCPETTIERSVLPCATTNR